MWVQRVVPESNWHKKLLCGRCIGGSCQHPLRDPSTLKIKNFIAGRGAMNPITPPSGSATAKSKDWRFKVALCPRSSMQV